MKNKINKTSLVLNHLKTYGSITSMEAFERYRATRLSAIIFQLRKRGLNIDTVLVPHTDMYGTNTRFARYVWREIEGV